MNKKTNQFRYIEKAKPFLRKQRFSQLKIDELVKFMDISKATFYKYFSSKNDVIEIFIDGCIDYLQTTNMAVSNKEFSFAKRFQKTYEQSLKSVIYLPDFLLQDLKESYPTLFEKICLAQQQRNKNLENFFALGIEQGYFRPINPILFMIQDETVLHRVMQPAFSIQYDLTIRQALFDFYLLKKYQLFQPEKLDTVDDSAMNKMISNILQTIL